MRKALGYISIFALGFAACVVVLRALGVFGGASPAEAKRNVLALLDRPPTVKPVTDTLLVQAAAKIEPAVVNIDTVTTGTRTMVDFFGEPFQRWYTVQGKGSGVIISPDGFIVTNNHVVEGATIIRVTTIGGQRYDGRLVGADTESDLAVVKVEAARLPIAEMGDSGRLKVGEYVLAIGYPLGIGTTVTHGIISATDRRNLELGGNKRLKQALQTDAPINPGNSGGALSNVHGQLIGINTAIATSDGGGGNIGIGFAIPINAVRGVIRDLIAHGRRLPRQAEEPFVGIRYAPLHPRFAEQMGLEPGVGAVIENVVPLTPGEQAGLQRGDVILAVDGKPVSTSEDVQAQINRHRVGDKARLTILRQDGTRKEVVVTLGRRPEALRQPSRPSR